MSPETEQRLRPICRIGKNHAHKPHRHGARPEYEPAPPDEFRAEPGTTLHPARGQQPALEQ
jgi:hypothetical protein